MTDDEPIVSGFEHLEPLTQKEKDALAIYATKLLEEILAELRWQSHHRAEVQRWHGK